MRLHQNEDWPPCSRTNEARVINWSTKLLIELRSCSLEQSHGDALIQQRLDISR